MRAISGDVQVTQDGGEIRVRTVSGDTRISSGIGPLQLQFESTSGDLRWDGTCAAACHAEVRTLSGNSTLALDPSSSFVLRAESHSGAISDELPATPVRSNGDGPSKALVSRHGSGAGSVECSTLSGAVRLTKR